ncbi:MAG TPA: threonine ammonia-lyase [Kineosporiaceae bacterium]|nr:threonine ammonia-lyase [Kineosporiaceae bacterium]
MSTATPAQTVSAADVRAAGELLGDVVRLTPVEPNRALSERIGGAVFLKCENLQRAGSFKIRGAYTRLARLDPDERACGVVAASAGNHAQGVALAAQLLGIRSRVYMPFGAPLPKIQATHGYGAEVEFAGQTVDESLEVARDWAQRSGAVFIHPFDHPDVVAGQGTVGLEILRQCPDVRTILVGTGGGGLLAGIAAAVRPVRPQVSVIGVQADGAAAWPASLAAGRPVALASMTTMADGIAVGRPGEVTFGIVQEFADGVVTVSEELISRALLLMLERAKLVVEPAGVVSVAALLDPDLAAGFAPPVVAVLSGGNIDPLLMLRVIQHGMAAAGRYLALRLRVPDRPGSLAALLAVLATTRANVLEVEHVRTSPKLSVAEVELALRLETQGRDHCAQVLSVLREAGYPFVTG